MLHSYIYQKTFGLRSNMRYEYILRINPISINGTQLIVIYIDIAIYIFRLSHLMMTNNIMYSYYNFYYRIIIPTIVYQFQLLFTISHYQLLF